MDSINEIDVLVCQALYNESNTLYNIGSDICMPSMSALDMHLKTIYGEDNLTKIATTHINPICIMSLETLENILMVVGEKLDEVLDKRVNLKEKNQ